MALMQEGQATLSSIAFDQPAQFRNLLLKQILIRARLDIKTQKRLGIGGAEIETPIVKDHAETVDGLYDGIVAPIMVRDLLLRLFCIVYFVIDLSGSGVFRDSLFQKVGEPRAAG